MPTPRPASSVSLRAVEKPGSKISSASSASDSASPSRQQAAGFALARMRARSRPAPSSANRICTSLPCWLTCTSSSPVSSLPAAARRARGSMPCTMALRSRCSNGAAIRSSTLRSISTAPPRMSRLTRLSISFAVWRATRNRRSDRLANGTMRTRIRSCCSSRVRRDCAARSSTAAPRVRAQALLEGGDVVHALGHHAGQFLQAREAVEFERVEFALAGDRQARGDLRLGLHLDFAQLAAQAWPGCPRSRPATTSASRPAFSSLERVIDTSPAWLTRRSRMSARTRTSGARTACWRRSVQRRVRRRRCAPRRAARRRRLAPGCCSCSNSSSAWS